MDIEKIEIETTNKKYITDISILVDRIDFLRDVQDLRSEWNITELYSPERIDSFLNWHIAENKNTIDDPNEVKRRLKKFNQDIIALRNKYNRTKNFDLIITYTVGCGVIPKYIYRSCYWDRILMSSDDNPNDVKNYQYVIVLSPRTEKRELEGVFNDYQKHIKSKIEFHEGDTVCIPGHEDYIEEHAFGTTYSTADIDKFKTLKKPARTREWYWMKYGDNFNDETKDVKKYPKVLEEWQARCPQKGEHRVDKEEKCPYCSINDVNIIERAIFEYIQLLKKS